jgi:hypothetical protein
VKAKLPFTVLPFWRETRIRSTVSSRRIASTIQMTRGSVLTKRAVDGDLVQSVLENGELLIVELRDD